MQKIRYLFLFTLLFCLVLSLACSHKNPAPIEEWEDQYPPIFVHKSIQIPELLRLSPDSMAQVVVGYVDMFNETEKYVPLLNPSADSSLPEYTITESGPPWVQSWKAKEGFLILLFITGNEYRYNWEVKFWGQDSVKNKFYDKWICITASNDFEGNNGSIELHNESSTNSNSRYSWYSYSRGVQNYRSFQLLKYTESTIDFLVDMTFDYDLSGELLRYSVDEENIYVEFKFSWNAFGKGEWWRYSENGEIIQSGSWFY